MPLAVQLAASADSASPTRFVLPTMAEELSMQYRDQSAQAVAPISQAPAASSDAPSQAALHQEKPSNWTALEKVNKYSQIKL